MLCILNVVNVFRCMLVKNEMRNMQNGTDHTRNAKMNSEKKKARITQEMLRRNLEKKGTDHTSNAKKKS